MVRKPQQELQSRHITKRVSAVMGKPQKAVSSSLLWHSCQKFAELYKAFPNIWTIEIREGEQDWESRRHFHQQRQKAEKTKGTQIMKRALLVVNSQLLEGWALRIGCVLQGGEPVLGDLSPHQAWLQVLWVRASFTSHLRVCIHLWLGKGCGNQGKSSSCLQKVVDEIAVLVPVWKYQVVPFLLF